MSCDVGTILPQSPALTISLSPDGSSASGYSLSFSDDLDYLCAVSWVEGGSLNLPGQPSLNLYDTMRICLRTGIYIQTNPDDDTQLAISGIPSEFGSNTVMYEYLHLANRLHVGQIDSGGRTVRLGGIGMIDLMDTDPAHFSYNSLPYAGMAIITDNDGNTLEVQSAGVILHKVQAQQSKLTFGSHSGVAPYNFVKEYAPGSAEGWIMVMGLVYSIPQ